MINDNQANISFYILSLKKIALNWRKIARRMLRKNTFIKRVAYLSRNPSNSSCCSLMEASRSRQVPKSPSLYNCSVASSSCQKREKLSHLNFHPLRFEFIKTTNSSKYFWNVFIYKRPLKFSSFSRIKTPTSVCSSCILFFFVTQVQV